jgi:hypothetical protein
VHLYFFGIIFLGDSITSNWFLKILIFATSYIPPFIVVIFIFPYSIHYLTYLFHLENYTNKKFIKSSTHHSKLEKTIFETSFYSKKF